MLSRSSRTSWVLSQVESRLVRTRSLAGKARDRRRASRVLVRGTVRSRSRVSSRADRVPLWATGNRTPARTSSLVSRPPSTVSRLRVRNRSSATSRSTATRDRSRASPGRTPAPRRPANKHGRRRTTSQACHNSRTANPGRRRDRPRRPTKHLATNHPVTNHPVTNRPVTSRKPNHNKASGRPPTSGRPVRRRQSASSARRPGRLGNPSTARRSNLSPS